MATSFSGGGSRREPPTMGKQLVNFITCGCESSVPLAVQKHVKYLNWRDDNVRNTQIPSPNYMHIRGHLKFLNTIRHRPIHWGGGGGGGGLDYKFEANTISFQK